MLVKSFVMDRPVERSHVGISLALGARGSWEEGAASSFQAGTVPREGGVMAHFWSGWWLLVAPWPWETLLG